MSNLLWHKEHSFDYPIPLNNELDKPYRTNPKLLKLIDYIFRHVKFEHRRLYIEVSTAGTRTLTKDMANVAVAITRHFIDNPQQYGHKMENIMMQIIIRMWKQTFKHCILQEKPLDKYYAAKFQLLTIENGLWEELIRTVDNKDYIQHGDDMVNKRIGVISNTTGKQVGLRERKNNKIHSPASLKEGGKQFEYLASLE